MEGSRIDLAYCAGSEVLRKRSIKYEPKTALLRRRHDQFLYIALMTLLHIICFKLLLWPCLLLFLNSTHVVEQCRVQRTAYMRAVAQAVYEANKLALTPIEWCQWKRLAMCARCASFILFSSSSASPLFLRLISVNLLLCLHLQTRERSRVHVCICLLCAYFNE